jgi:GNAT superfamily N-acetyltransferase
MLRAPFGGGAMTVRGARLMASGLATPKWNNADITAVDFDRDSVVDWYARHDVPWGVRVPLEFDVEIGEPLFEKRCAGLLPNEFKPAPTIKAISVRQATPTDLDAYAAVERVRFGGDDQLERRWLGPAIGAPGFHHWIAAFRDEPVGVAMTVSTDELAGPAGYLAGVATAPAWANRGLEAMLAGWAARAAFDAGATLVHTNPDEDERTWVAELGFVEVPGFLVRVVRLI